MSEKIQPFSTCTPKPSSLARSRSGVNMVPSMNGRFMRVRPSPWLAADIVVSTTVADEAPQQPSCRGSCAHLSASSTAVAGAPAGGAERDARR